MKALTICQPFAHLIVRGEKRVENREWPTSYRGQLMIHAGKSREWLDPYEDETYLGDELSFQRAGDPLVFGAVVGLAQLADCLHIDRIQRGEYDAKHPWLRDHEHTNGTWCWVLVDVRRIEPVPYRGAQGLFDIPDYLLSPLESAPATRAASETAGNSPMAPTEPNHPTSSASSPTKGGT